MQNRPARAVYYSEKQVESTYYQSTYTYMLLY